LVASVGIATVSFVACSTPTAGNLPGGTGTPGIPSPTAGNLPAAVPNDAGNGTRNDAAAIDASDDGDAGDARDGGDAGDAGADSD
jgi:hypothetical protein